jgi:hypothetical protein
MLMQNFALDAQDAFALLACLSQDTNTKLKDVAARIRDELTAKAPPDVRQSTPGRADRTSRPPARCSVA